MKTFRIAALALAVSGVFATGAKAGSSTNDWWDVDFDILGAEAALNPADAMVTLTNKTVIQGVEVSHQTWDEGFWTTLDGDETTVTNEFNPTNTFKQYGTTTCLKLDTQGNDLTWFVDPTNTMADSRTALVDADLYLVGSDSPPDAADFDGGGDVQAAVYLKNETNEDTGETTNSVLCVYVWDSNANGGNGGNVWQELKGNGIKLYDNSWASVKVVVDHAKVVDPQNPYPTVQVFVNGVLMTARDGDADHWTAANADSSQTAARVSSVAFRGTGAVDNFVGKTVETTFDTFNFTAQVLMDGTNVLTTGNAGNVTRTLPAEAGEGKTVSFPSFEFHDQHWDDNAIDPVTGEPGAYVVSYALTKIEIVNLATDTTQTFNYGYNREDGIIVVQTESPNIHFDTETGTDEDTGDEYEYYSGPFSVSASTAGATQDETIVRIYFETLPEEGDFKLTATQNVGTAPADQKYNVNNPDLPAFATFTFAESITAGGTSYILSKIKPGTAPTADPITLEYESPNAVVKVPLSAEITGTLYNVATATYVEGTLGDKVLGYEWDATNGEWAFTAKDKPVAMIGDVEYPSLRAAVAAAQTGDTIVMVADDAVTFTAENPILDIEIAVTIDGGSNTLYGISDFAGEGYNEVRIGGSGNVTIKDLAFSEFGDTAPLSGASMPICTRSTYTGKLTLDGVTIDKFNRQAVLLCGGEFFVTNCTITGCAGSGKTSYFQSAFENYFAAGTIVDTTVTGIGALDAGTNGEGDPWAAAVFTVNPSGNGSYTVLSGDYEGQFIVAANLNSAGSVILSNGTFVATAPKTNEVEGVQTPVSAFLLEGNVAVTVAGGWYDREPEEGFIADGLAAYEDAPGTDAPWTVRAEKFTITFMNGATKLDEIEVQKNGAVAYAGETPVKEGTDQYSYTFAGWSTTDGGEALESLPAATADATYYAVFTESVNKYEVEWIVDGVYSTNEWDYGATPSWDGENVPTKASTDATNFMFKAWDPAVVAVTGFASYTATWTETAREYAVTFKTNGVVYATVQAEWNATDYAPAAPAAPDGKVFKGWAAEEAPTTVLETLPPISGEATYVAVFDDDVVEPPEVDVGDNLLANDGAPMEFAADGKCTVRFRAPATGVYVLLSSTTVNGTYVADEAASATKTVTDLEDNLVELTEGTAGTTKFFKIGWSPLP